jgi:2-(1,2-epoxy-1,2-dihydrophenyl)acetyl-CoA isomerase
MPTETNPSVAVRTAGAVRYVVLNRPGRYNAITVPMMRRLGDALDDAERDDAIRCIVLTATGPGFCTGQDLGVLAKQYEHQPVSSIADKLRDDYNPVVERIRALDKPIIAAVQGVAAGAGWSLALACDVRVGGAVGALRARVRAVGAGAGNGRVSRLGRSGRRGPGARISAVSR